MRFVDDSSLPSRALADPYKCFGLHSKVAILKLLGSEKLSDPSHTQTYVAGLVSMGLWAADSMWGFFQRTPGDVLQGATKFSLQMTALWISHQFLGLLLRIQDHQNTHTQPGTRSILPSTEELQTDLDTT